MAGCRPSEPPVCQLPDPIPTPAPDTQTLVELSDATEKMAQGVKALAYDLSSIRDLWERETIGASVAFIAGDGWRVGVLGPDDVMTPWSDRYTDSSCSGACASARGGGYLDDAVVSPEGVTVQCRGVSLGGSGSVLCGERVGIPRFQSTESVDVPDSMAFIP